VCSNGYVSKEYGNIAVEQLADPYEDDFIYWIMGILGGFVVLLLAVGCYLRTSDVKKDKKWKSKYMEKRLAQIEQ